MRKKIFLSFLALSCALLVLLTGVLVFGAYRLEQRQLVDSLATEADTLASALETTQDNAALLSALSLHRGEEALGAYTDLFYALRQAVKILIDVGHMEILLHAVADAFAELRFHLALDDEHHIAETCAPCVKQGKVDDDMSFRINRLDLFEPPEAAAHSGSHDD